jgi:hypothetical protein
MWANMFHTHTTYVNIKKICIMCFIWISEQTAIIPQHSISLLIVTAKECLLCCRDRIFKHGPK